MMECSGKIFDGSEADKTLFQALLDARGRYGRKKVILEDQERRPYTYDRLVLSSLVLGRKISKITRPSERIGVFMPSSAATAVLFFGLNAFGRIPAMLNFTSGVRNLLAACELSHITTILASRRFVEHGRLDDVINALSFGRNIVWIEDLAGSLSSFDKIRGVWDLWQAGSVHAKHKMQTDEEAVIVFTSGSEGLPKGVVLSSSNLLSNASQIKQHAKHFFTTDDIMFNTLPIFHTFGLTAGMILGLMTGMKVILYPSPLHYKQIPKLIAATKATFVFSTDTFLQGYVKAAGKEDLSCVRYIVSGAERVRQSTREAWEKFNTVILEGYGASECSPVIAVNLPDKLRDGTVGTLLPGIEASMIPVDGVHEGGRLQVKGPNVMVGYINMDNPAEFVRPHNGWHDTGDIVSFDADDFITIRGRAKRFAKIGGEMISLAAVEAIAQGIWPEEPHAAVSLPDTVKGEQIILLTTRSDADRDSLLQYARSEGFPELWVPKGILVVDAIPVTGMGKIDYAGAREKAEAMKGMLSY